MTADRLARMRTALERELRPVQLDVRDDSAAHAGHAGARGGAGHFHVRIVSEAFSGLTSVERHRRVYAALGDMMGADIHALAIEAATPRESASKSFTTP
jgi:BolA family transcriptional regulator, general stress-responsive regulator